ncbi:protein DpdF [Ensifer sp. R-19]|uniref:protein DpdF n=1 Tax=Ensifer sp. R-19 TaxID=3404055 RepID=UPI003CE76BB4
MIELDGHEAFAALIGLLADKEDGQGWRSASPAIERLRHALCESPCLASQLDLAVLLRQALRHEHARRGYKVSPTVLVTHSRLSDFRGWEKAGLEVEAASSGVHVTALPWQPDWLGNGRRFTVEGVDGLAASETTRREFGAADDPGDPFLASIKRRAYRSRGQRAAVRAALSTPVGGTLVVALPTGEGKSMIFQLAQSVGFTGSDNQSGKGVTLVIVPTVALGINHEQEGVEICGLSKPLLYQGGNDVQNAVIAQRIVDGSQGLCFTSPEAACGALRAPLRRAAEAGHLRALVVDEAHLVDQWGTGFRTEFQELSSLRRELIAAAPPTQRMRTILLSATLTDTSLETLQTLFGTDGHFESIAAVQLRPEPDYWISADTPEAVRVDRVLEALHHAPRPAVLYVTEVDEANAWYSRLIDAGFRRVRKLHGKTQQHDRESTVSQWRDGVLDIVVGTSAFGLGIDYAHARSVIHACVPETLDRFYQEVGRGGRDGKASLSIIVPTPKDYKTAESINAQKVIGIDRGLQRWSTMFTRKLSLGSARFAVRIDGRPGSEEGDIDMVGDANTDWNLRTLTLMARAGLIRMLGTPYPRILEKGDWLEIDIVDDHHLDENTWRERVEPFRREIWLANKRNLDLMRKFLASDRCPAEVFEELYGADRVSRTCSRCSKCRVSMASRHQTRPVGEPRAPWPGVITPEIDRLLDRDGRLLVTYDHDELDRKASRRLGESFHRLQKDGLSKLLILGRPPFDMARVLQFAEYVPFFVSHVPSLALSRLPKGPEIVLVGNDQQLFAQNLEPRSGAPRIFIAPRDQKSHDQRRLRDVFGGRTLTLGDFFSRVTQ